MENFRGFKPYIEMFNTGQIKPGQFIVVESLDYQVLPIDSRDEYHVYRVLGRFDAKRNVKSFLKNREWHIKKVSFE